MTFRDILLPPLPRLLSLGKTLVNPPTPNQTPEAGPLILALPLPVSGPLAPTIPPSTGPGCDLGTFLPSYQCPGFCATCHHPWGAVPRPGASPTPPSSRLEPQCVGVGGGVGGRALSSIRHGKLPGPEDRGRNNPMAAGAAQELRWQRDGGARGGRVYRPSVGAESSRKQAWGPGESGSGGRPLAALVGPRPPLSKLLSLWRARALGRSRGCSLVHLGDDEPTGGDHRAQGGIEPWAWGH